MKEGVSTKRIDEYIMKKISNSNSIPAFLGFHGYPGNSCISINEEVVHGLPDEKRIIKNGDIVSVDIGVKHNGYIADSAVTYMVGDVSSDASKLMDVTYNSLLKGIQQAVVDNRIGDIGFAIESYADSFNYNVVRDFVGHGVGIEVHEEPQVPNYGKKGKGVRLKSGMVLAIEPMVSMGSGDVIVKKNGWTVVTAEKMLSAHFEHTVAIINNGPVILTI